MRRKTNSEAARAIAIDLIVAGKTWQEVADGAKIARSTLCRWRADPDFKQELKEAQMARRQQTINRLIDVQLPALKRLEEILAMPLREGEGLSVIALTRAIGIALGAGAAARSEIDTERIKELEGLTESLLERIEGVSPSSTAYSSRPRLH